MGSPRKESPEKKTPSDQSLNELMELLLKLNAQLRENVPPRKKNQEARGDNLEMVIIIVNSSPGRKKPLRTEKPQPLAGDWMQDLFADIERGSGGR